MALARDRIEAAGLATAVPSFEALEQVQDKVSACHTLARIGVPQPPSVIVGSAAELADAAEIADETGTDRTGTDRTGRTGRGRTGRGRTGPGRTGRRG